MNDEHEKLGTLLRRSVRPMGDSEPKADLWPRMLRRMEERAPSVPWFDWLIAGAPLLWFIFFPEHIPFMLYLL